jgi:hypothetical protein
MEDTVDEKVKSKRKTIKIILYVAAFVVVAAVLTIARGLIFGGTSSDEGARNISGTQQNSFGESAFTDNEIVESLPSSGIIELKVGEEYYTISKGSIEKERAENPDLTIVLPASYSSDISGGLCGVIKKANDRGELSIEMHSSKAALMWKYKGMLKYQGCLDD